MSKTGWRETTKRARALAAEATVLSRAGRTPTDHVAWLGSAAAWLAEVAPPWEQMAGQVPSERSYRRVFSARSLEVWLICWPRGGGLQLHDHGGASGAFEVLEGALEERYIHGRRRSDGTLTAVGLLSVERSVEAGHGVAFDGSYIHDVRNTAAPVTTSVHVYSAAERSMAFYRVDGELIRTVPLGEARSLIEAEVAAEGRSADLGTHDRTAADRTAADLGTHDRTAAERTAVERSAVDRTAVAG